jgi:alpha-glucoside transport system substrate-binding protein
MKHSSKKSIFSILMIGALLLVACGSSSTPSPTAPAPAAGGQPTTAAQPTMAATTAAQPTAASTMAAQPTSAAGQPTMASTSAAGGAAAAGPIDCAGAKQGDTLSLLYQWSGLEEQNIQNIIKPLADACGIVFKYESTRDQGLLDTRVKAGTPPDIAFWQISTIKTYTDKLVPMTDLGANAANYSQSFKDQGTVNGKWLGLPVKTDIKTIVWYSPTNFQALGYTVPTDWNGLNTLADKMVADNHVPWSTGFESGGATGWTGADFIEDILLAQKGPAFVRGLIDGSVPYTDPGVKAAFQQYFKWAADPKYDVGGPQGTLSTAFGDAIFKPFTDPPQAMMVRQSGFAGASIKTQFPALNYPADYDFFQLPGAQGMQVGSDWMMSFSKSAAAKAFVTYLTSTAGAQKWAQVGFDLTPNTAGADAYTDPLLKKKGQLLYSAKEVVPSVGDVIPGGFNTSLWQGIINYVNGGNIDQILTNLATAQAADVKK